MKMEKKLVYTWFNKWELGQYHDLPISDGFKHHSPFGTIDGKSTYLNLIRKNEDKFLGHKFVILDEIFAEGKACVRYLAKQNDFKMEVSEWYYFENGLISEIHAYYHIGEIREDRKLE